MFLTGCKLFRTIAGFAKFEQADTVYKAYDSCVRFVSLDRNGFENYYKITGSRLRSFTALPAAVPPGRARLAAARTPRVCCGRARARQLRFESASPQTLEVGRVEDGVARGGGEVRGERGVLSSRFG